MFIIKLGEDEFIRRMKDSPADGHFSDSALCAIFWHLGTDTPALGVNYWEFDPLQLTQMYKEVELPIDESTDGVVWECGNNSTAIIQLTN